MGRKKLTDSGKKRGNNARKAYQKQKYDERKDESETVLLSCRVPTKTKDEFDAIKLKTRLQTNNQTLELLLDT